MRNTKVKVLTDLIQTKEYDNLMKCTANHCRTMAKMLEAEKKIILAMKDTMDFVGILDDKERVKRSRKIIVLTAKMMKLKQDREALLCTMTKCTEQLVDYQIKHRQLASDAADKIEKNMQRGYIPL